MTCEFYPKEFNRIVILCVQKKLVEGINREINEFVHSKNSIISRNDILVIDNNEEVIKKAIDNGAFEKFIDQIESCIEVLSSGNVKELTFGCKRIKKTYEGIKNLFQQLARTNVGFMLGKVNFLRIIPHRCHVTEKRTRSHAHVFGTIGA